MRWPVRRPAAGASPEDSHVVTGDFRIMADEVIAAVPGLCDQQSVKRVAVDHRQGGEAEDVVHAHTFDQETVALLFREDFG